MKSSYTLHGCASGRNKTLLKKIVVLMRLGPLRAVVSHSLFAFLASACKELRVGIFLSYHAGLSF